MDMHIASQGSGKDSVCVCHIHAGMEDQETDTCMNTETCIVKTIDRNAYYTHVYVSTRIKFFVRKSATHIKVLVWVQQGWHAYTRHLLCIMLHLLPVNCMFKLYVVLTDRNRVDNLFTVL